MRAALFREKYLLLLIFVIASLVRISYSFSGKVIPYNDARHYDKIALNLSLARGYRETEGPILKDGSVSWAPLYPFLLAGIYKVFGHSYPAVWIFQALLSAGACILIYLIGRMVFNQRIAYLSAIISVFCFNFVLYSSMLLTETLYIFLLLLTFFYLFRAFSSSSLRKYILAGLFAGLTTLTNPVVIIFFAFFFLWGLRKGFLRQASVFLISLTIVILPWIVRNYQIYHRFIFIRACAGENFWLGNHPGANGEQGDEKTMPAELKNNPLNLSPLELDSKGYREGLKFIKQNPVRFIALMLKKTSLFWSPLRTDGWWPHLEGFASWLAIIFSFLFSVFILFFGALGIVFSFKHSDIYKFWLRAFIFICWLSLIPFIVEPRYRLPIYPFLIIFTGYALNLMPEIKSKNKEDLKYLKIFIILVVFLLLNTVYDFIANLGEIKSRMSLLF